MLYSFRHNTAALISLKEKPGGAGRLAAVLGPDPRARLPVCPAQMRLYPLPSSLKFEHLPPTASPAASPRPHPSPWRPLPPCRCFQFLDCTEFTLVICSIRSETTASIIGRKRGGCQAQDNTKSPSHGHWVGWGLGEGRSAGWIVSQ